MNFSNETQERVAKAKESLRAVPYGLEAWSVLIKYYQTQPIKNARQFYESLLKHFPSSGRYWKIYIDHEIKSRTFEQVERIFQRCLNDVLNIELWKTYLSYIREQKAAMIRAEPKDTVMEVREQVVQAYEFALSKVGLDIHSYTIWNDYLNYLKSAPAPRSAQLAASQPGGVGQEYADGQKIVVIRKVFQRAVVTPMLQLEAIWRDYSSWEQSINPQIAIKMLEARQKEYLVAKKVARELDQMTRGLNRNAPALPPSGGSSSDERRQVDMWRKIIEWEKCNNCKSSDPAMVIQRVVFTYEQCLQCMAHHPAIWFEAADYIIKSAEGYREKNPTYGKLLEEQAKKIFERAIADESPVRASMLVHFQYAEFLEKLRKYDQVHRVYQRLYQTAIGGGLVVIDGVESQSTVNKEHDPISGLNPLRMADPTLVYIQHMRFSRRVEGIKSARAIFKKARADDRISHQVYVFAAQMEYNCTKDTAVSQKIFELGLKRFKSSPEFLHEYTKFMQTLNESNNTRVLYERVLSEQSSGMDTDKNGPSSSSSQAKFLWSDYLKFEALVGDLASIQSVEHRKIQNTIAEDAGMLTNPFTLTDAVKQTSNTVGIVRLNTTVGKVKESARQDNTYIRSDIIQRNCTHIFIDRYRFLDLVPCSEGELKSQGVDSKSLQELSLELGNTNEDEGGDAKKSGKKNEEKPHHWRLGRRPMADQVAPEQRKKYTENESFARPVFTQATPFKPEHHPWPTRIGTKGGNFPAPAAGAALMRLMPPPRCFLGPFVIIDQLLSRFKSMKLPDKKDYVNAVKSGEFSKLPIQNGDSDSVNEATKQIQVKQEAIDDSTVSRKRTAPLLTTLANGTLVKDEAGNVDIFKLRQVKRNKQLNIQ